MQPPDTRPNGTRWPMTKAVRHIGRERHRDAQAEQPPRQRGDRDRGLRQSRPSWEGANKALCADGELFRLHDAYRAAEIPADDPTIEAEDTSPRTEGIPAETDLTDLRLWS